MSAKLESYANNLRNGMFAKRETTNQALNYAYDLIDSIEGADKVAAMTALHVVLNTVSNDIKKYSKEG